MLCLSICLGVFSCPQTQVFCSGSVEFAALLRLTAVPCRILEPSTAVCCSINRTHRVRVQEGADSVCIALSQFPMVACSWYSACRLPPKRVCISTGVGISTPYVVRIDAESTLPPSFLLFLPSAGLLVLLFLTDGKGGCPHGDAVSRAFAGSFRPREGNRV